MRQTACGLAAIALSLSGVYGQDKTGKTPMGNIEKAILAQEQALYEAVTKQDKASFESLTVADGAWGNSSGFVPLGLLAGGLDVFHISKFSIVNPHVRRLDDESALVTYARTGEGTFGGQPFAPTTLVSTVWVKRNGSWRAIHHQETDLTKLGPKAAGTGRARKPVPAVETSKQRLASGRPKRGAVSLGTPPSVLSRCHRSGVGSRWGR